MSTWQTNTRNILEESLLTFDRQTEHSQHVIKSTGMAGNCNSFASFVLWLRHFSQINSAKSIPQKSLMNKKVLDPLSNVTFIYTQTHSQYGIGIKILRLELLGTEQKYCSVERKTPRVLWSLPNNESMVNRLTFKLSRAAMCSRAHICRYLIYSL